MRSIIALWFGVLCAGLFLCGGCNSAHADFGYDSDLEYAALRPRSQSAAVYSAPAGYRSVCENGVCRLVPVQTATFAVCTSCAAPALSWTQQAYSEGPVYFDTRPQRRGLFGGRIRRNR